MANNGQQRPPFEHAQRARIWPGNFNYSAHSAHSHAALTTEHNDSTIQVYFQVVRQWARREPSGGISAADAGAASMWQWI